MSDQNREMFTRRKMLTGMATIALGGVVGRTTDVAAEEPIVVPDAPPLPWKWVELEPSDGMNQQQGHMECLMCHEDHSI